MGGASTTSTVARTVTDYRCALCGGKLPQGRWVTGKDRKITGGIPRYHYPGECLKRKKPISDLRLRKEG